MMQRKKWILYAIALLVSAGLFAQSWSARDQSPASFPPLPSEAALFGQAAPTGVGVEPLPAMPGTEPSSRGPVQSSANGAQQTPPPPVQSAASATGEPDWLFELDTWSKRALELSQKPGAGSLEQLALLLEGRELPSDRASDSSVDQIPSTILAGSVQPPSPRPVQPTSAMLSVSVEDRELLLTLAQREPLQGVLHLGSTRSVLMGGRTRQVGDAIGTSGARIEEIHARSVVLVKGRARMEIELGVPTRTPVSAQQSQAQAPSTAVETELPPMPEIAVGASSSIAPTPKP